MVWKPPQIHPKPLRHNNGWKIHFSYSGKQYKTYIGRDERIAYALQSRVNNLIAEFKCGLLILPENTSLPDFIFFQVLQKPDPEEVKQAVTVSRLSHLMSKYIENTVALNEKAPNTIKSEKIHLNHLKRFLKHQQCDPFLEDITVGFFNDYKCYRKEQGVLHNTINKELGTLQVMFRFGVENAFVKTNVVRDVRRGKKETPRDRFKSHSKVTKLLEKGNYSAQELRELKRYRYFTCDELRKLIDLAKNKYDENHWLVPILIAFCNTGLRLGELLRLQWQDIDFEESVVKIISLKQSTKEKETKRTIGLTLELQEVLMEQKSKTQNERLVFPGPKGGSLSTYTLRSSFQKF